MGRGSKDRWSAPSDTPRHTPLSGHSLGHFGGVFGPEGPEDSCRGPRLSQLKALVLSGNDWYPPSNCDFLALWVLFLEGPTRKPRLAGVFSTHSDMQAVPAFHCIRMCKGVLFRHASFKTHRHAAYHCLKEVQKPFQHASVFKTRVSTRACPFLKRAFSPIQGPFRLLKKTWPIRAVLFGRDFYQTYARITGNQALTQVFGAPFRLKHRKINKKPPERVPFFCAKVGLRETLVIVPSELFPPLQKTFFLSNVACPLFKMCKSQGRKKHDSHRRDRI